VAGIAAIVAGPVVAGLVGAIGLLISVFYALTLSVSDLLSYSANRLIGTVAGIVLSVILAQHVIISFPALFVIGFLWLMIAILRLLVIELATAVADSNKMVYGSNFA
jgi:hypothetical protein